MVLFNKLVKQLLSFKRYIYTPMLAPIKDILYSKRRIILFVLLLILAFFLFWDIVSATDTWAVPNPAGWWETTQEVQNKWWQWVIISSIQWILKVASVIVSLMTYLATMFLSPEWINGSLFNMTYYFRQVWIIISNVVYLIFAFVLVYIAFMNIIWKWEDYGIKKILPKFIIWILIVPLSWFIVQFVLSLSAILTVSALNLPFDTFSNYAQDMGKIQIPKKCTINLSEFSSSEKNTDWKSDPYWFIKCGIWADWEEEKISLNEFLSSTDSSDSIFWVIATYTYWVMSFESLDTVFKNQKIETISDLLIKTAFDAVFFIIYLVIIVALWIVLFTRWIYIWIYIMISPLFWLMYFFDTKEWSSWFFWKFTVMEFVKLALVPVFAMAALSFWMLFLYVVWKWMTLESNGRDLPGVSITPGKESTILNIWSKKVWLEIIWPAVVTENSTDFFSSLWNWALWIIGSLIIKVFGIVVLWWVMMAALQTSKVTEEIIKPLVDFWSQVWNVIQKAPMYAPILPWKASIASAWATGAEINSIISQMWVKRAEKSWSKFLPNKDEETQNRNDLRTNAIQNLKKPIEKVIEWLNSASDFNKASALNQMEWFFQNEQVKNKLWAEFDDLYKKYRDWNFSNTQDIATYLSELERKLDHKIIGSKWVWIIYSSDIEGFMNKKSSTDTSSSTNTDTSKKVTIWTVEVKVEQDWKNIVFTNTTDGKDTLSKEEVKTSMKTTTREGFKEKLINDTKNFAPSIYGKNREDLAEEVVKKLETLAGEGATWKAEPTE